jgi:hypothetical protein
VSEIPLVGGDVNVGENVVVRVGDTVRRPQSDRAEAVHALFLHFESVGFDGAQPVLDGEERRPGRREMWDACSGARIQARIAWLEKKRHDLLAFLR